MNLNTRINKLERELDKIKYEVLEESTSSNFLYRNSDHKNKNRPISWHYRHLKKDYEL